MNNYRLQNYNLDISYYKINDLVYSIKKVTKMITSTLRNKCTLQMTEQDHFFSPYLYLLGLSLTSREKT